MSIKEFFKYYFKDIGHAFGLMFFSIIFASFLGSIHYMIGNISLILFFFIIFGYHHPFVTNSHYFSGKFTRKLVDQLMNNINSGEFDFKRYSYRYDYEAVFDLPDVVVYLSNKLRSEEKELVAIDKKTLKKMELTNVMTIHDLICKEVDFYLDKQDVEDSKNKIVIEKNKNLQELISAMKQVYSNDDKLIIDKKEGHLLKSKI